MNQTLKLKLCQDMDVFIDRINNQKKIYEQLIALSENDDTDDKIYRIDNPQLFQEVIKNFGPSLDHRNAKHDLSTIFEAGIHKETGSLIISNKGATLFCKSPKSATSYITRHIGLCIYVPGLGIELVNVGLVGNVYQGPVVLRSESACTPSFLFGSQRCNCSHQWDSIQEIAAKFNTIETPETHDGEKFEQWVQNQCSYQNHRHLFKQDGPGFILMHLDTQNGMGSGYSDGEFSFDLFTRASMRHRGEYSSEQIHQTSMSGGFEAIGLKPDPRQANDRIGYKVSFIVLDYLATATDIVMLTNNPLKVKSFQENGYTIKRLPLIGEVNAAGASEAEQRGADFDHLDICNKEISFAEDVERVTNEIKELFSKK